MAFSYFLAFGKSTIIDFICFVINFTKSHLPATLCFLVRYMRPFVIYVWLLVIWLLESQPLLILTVSSSILLKAIFQQLFVSMSGIWGLLLCMAFSYLAFGKSTIINLNSFLINFTKSHLPASLCFHVRYMRPFVMYGF